MVVLVPPEGMDLIGAYRIEETLEIAVVARCGVLRVAENRAMGRDDERTARRDMAQVGFDPAANFVRKADRILLLGGRRMVEKDVVEEQIMDFPDVHRVVRRTEIAFVALQGERIGQLGRIVIVVARQAEGREAKRLQPLTVLREKRHIVPDQVAQADSINLRRKPLHGFQHIGNDMTEIGIHRRVIGSQLNVGHNDQRMTVGRGLAPSQREVGPVDGLFAIYFAVEPRTALRGGDLAIGWHGDKNEIAPRKVGGQIVDPPFVGRRHLQSVAHHNPGNGISGVVLHHSLHRHSGLIGDLPGSRAVVAAATLRGGAGRQDKGGEAHRQKPHVEF